MIQRIADKDGGCYAPGCDHTVRYTTQAGESCASHLPLEDEQHPTFDLVEAITFVALEAGDMEVNAEGEVRLKEDS